MKAVILCGGMGSRLSEETILKPKPMVEIGGRPILWHLMKLLSAQGIREFILALGYKGEVIKHYFMNYHYHFNDFTVDTRMGLATTLTKGHDDWKVYLINTGAQTETGGRLKQLGHIIGDARFLMTYCDGLANIDIHKLCDFHIQTGKLATVTAVHPPARFGALDIKGSVVTSFKEKPQASEGWINGGFFIMEPTVLEYIADDRTLWEKEPMEKLAARGQLAGYQHVGFWQCMDTMRDVRQLESLWQSGNAPWKNWND